MEKIGSIKNKKAFAEIVTSSIIGWQAQSWQWDYFPSFGSLVAVEQTTRIVFGIVHQIETGSIDPARSPFIYQKTEEELLAEQPQIFEFLKTTFSCLVIGYQEQNVIHYQVTPEPPKIHTFVYHVDDDLFKHFCAKTDYLHLLFGFSHQIINLDELLLALLKQLADKQLLTETIMESFIEKCSLLQGNDYRRLKLFLQRAQTFIM